MDSDNSNKFQSITQNPNVSLVNSSGYRSSSPSKFSNNLDKSNKITSSLHPSTNIYKKKSSFAPLSNFSDKTEKSNKSLKSSHTIQNMNFNSSDGNISNANVANNFFNIINVNINTNPQGASPSANLPANLPNLFSNDTTSAHYQGLFNFELLNNQQFVNSSIITNINENFKNNYLFFNETPIEENENDANNTIDNKNTNTVGNSSSNTNNRNSRQINNLDISVKRNSMVIEKSSDKFQKKKPLPIQPEGNFKDMDNITEQKVLNKSIEKRFNSINSVNSDNENSNGNVNNGENTEQAIDTKESKLEENLKNNQLNYYVNTDFKSFSELDVKMNNEFYENSNINQIYNSMNDNQNNHNNNSNNIDLNTSPKRIRNYFAAKEENDVNNQIKDNYKNNDNHNGDSLYNNKSKICSNKKDIIPCEDPLMKQNKESNENYNNKNIDLSSLNK